MTKKINVAVVGATGYVGLELVKILSNHANVSIINLCARKNIGKKISFFDKSIKKKLPTITNIDKVNWSKIDLLFLSLPNGEAQKIIVKLYERYNKLKFIDLSADFRLKDQNQYLKWYKKKHKAKQLINKSIYSIPEISRKQINNYRIVSNPGCYPTSVQIPLIPLIKKNFLKNTTLRIDSKSGYSGAGKNFNKKFSHKNLYKSIFTYGLNGHRHYIEIKQELETISKNKIKLTFNPQVIPTFRGILTSIYIESRKNLSSIKIINILKKYYKKMKFVKINKLNQPINSGNVINTNNCEISVCEDKISKKIVIFSVIDNLIKGASGQATQNMNMMFGLSESKGLK